MENSSTPTLSWLISSHRLKPLLIGVQPVARRCLGDLTEQGRNVAIHHLAQRPVARDLNEERGRGNLETRAAYLADRPYPKGAAGDQWHAHEALVAHRGDLDDRAVLERGDQRDDAVERKVHVLDWLARLEQHRLDLHVERPGDARHPIAVRGQHDLKETILSRVVLCSCHSDPGNGL